MTADFELFVAEGRVHVPVTDDDRQEAARGLVYHGYPIAVATRKAMIELADTDGLLQMLARHRIAYSREHVS